MANPMNRGPKTNGPINNPPRPRNTNKGSMAAKAKAPAEKAAPRATAATERPMTRGPADEQRKGMISCATITVP